jgi:hypothetical protein
MKKIEILPSYIYEFDMPEEITNKVLHFVKDLQYKKTLQRTNQSSESMSLHKEDIFKQAHSVIKDKMNDLIKELKFTINEFKIVNTHANVTKKGEWHTPHDHANAVFSSVWYLNDCDCETYFYRLNDWMDNWVNMYPPRTTGGSMGSTFSFKYLHWYDVEGNPLVEGFKPFIIHKQKSIKNKVLLFPAKLLHLTNANKNDYPRYTVTFNMFPSNWGQSTITVDLK